MRFDAFEQWAMSFDGAVLLGYLLAHRDRDVPRAITVVAHAAQFLAHETVGAGVNDFFQFGGDRVESVENPLRHEPARFRGEALEAIKLVRRALGLWPGEIFHRIGRSMTITRTAQHAARGALFQSFSVEPLLDPLEA